jgi:hypothetical protein
MALHRTLKNQLVQSGLLPKSISGIKSFEDLSAALIRKNKKAEVLVSCDPDLDPSTQTYENLIRQFLNAADDVTVTDLTVSHDSDADEFSVSLSKNGEPMEATWVQATSSVSEEFMGLVERLADGKNGRLLRLAEEDALTYLYLNKGLADAIEEWRDNPNVERWSFWEQIPHWRQSLEEEHPILPLQYYYRIRERLARDFLRNGDDPLDVSDYRMSCAKLPYLSDDKIELIDDDFPDGLGNYLHVEDKFFPGLENWVADKRCYVLVLDSPLNIVFEATPKKGERIRAETSGYKSFLYLDKDFEWSICVFREDRLQGEYTPANNTLIISGESVLNKIADRIRKHGPDT